MYNLKQKKIWKAGGVLFLSLLLFHNRETIGHAEEAAIVSETTNPPETTNSQEITTVPEELSSDTLSDESSTDAPQPSATPFVENPDIVSEEFPMPWIYTDGSLQIYTNGEYQKFTGNNVKMKVLGTSLSSDFSGIVYDKHVMIPIEGALKDSKINAEYTYDSETHFITITKRNRKIVMYPGSTKVLVNGVETEMTAAPQLVTDAEGNVEQIMVPARFVMTSLGYKYTWNTSTKTMKITRKNITYFSWMDTKEIALSSEVDESLDNISAITAKYQDGLDIVKISCENSDSVKITKGTKKITLTYNGTAFSDQSYLMDLSDAYIARELSVTQSNADTVKIVLKKTSSKKYYIQQTSGYINIIMGQTPIRIAVDCGHGANTPGKRTPPMPVAIDYNHDGKVDFKKGQCIKEHVPNVGVGKYLAEELERCGFDVYRSAFGATDVSLANRQKNIKNFNSDYSVSVHFNAAGTGTTFNSGQGVEVFYHKNASQAGQSKKFAQTILKYMAKGTPQVNRGVKTMALALCNTKETGAKASILVECAFMTNRNEAINMVGNADFWKETAQEIAQGICEYTGVNYVKE